MIRAADVLRLASGALTGHARRSVLMLLAMAIGVAAVVVLTALGEGARRYVTGEFAALGTHLLIVLPGRSETTGGHPPLMGETPRDLTLDDALALRRSRHVNRVAPITVGSAPVSWQRREREVSIIGSTASFLSVRHLGMAQGRFLPETDPRVSRPVCVIGNTVRRELFGPEPAVGRWVRIGDRRFRVIGILASEGRSIGIDLDDVVIIPVASAQALFDTPSLFRILVEARSRPSLEAAKQDIQDTIRHRHEGEEDVTVITQDAVIATFDKIFHALTLTVAGIAAISLSVAGILIMNVMLVSVSQRTAEIGLLKALGAPARQVMLLFLSEAGLLSFLGAGIGLALGLLAAQTVRAFYPVLEMVPPPWALAAAAGVALATGLVFGVLPAKRAAGLDPVQALARH
jgi:putative ABC transport system permease protein